VVEEKMKTRNLIPVFMILVTLGLSACAGAAATSKTLTEADNGSTVQLRNGEKLVVELSGNPTTGYSWEPVLPGDSIVRQIGQAEFTPESNKLGADGTVVLTFQAVATGQQNLQLVYHRPFESDVAPIHSFTVKVVVR
jgi:inhibitor of cysteine peptidase